MRMQGLVSRARKTHAASRSVHRRPAFGVRVNGLFGEEKGHIFSFADMWNDDHGCSIFLQSSTVVDGGERSL